MRTSLALTLLCASAACTLDPQRELDRAQLRVHVEGLPPDSAELVLTATTAQGAQVKHAAVQGLTAVEVLYQEATLGKGPVDLAGVARGLDGGELACGSSRAELDGGSGEARMAMTRATDDLNCGACGRACARPNATSTCGAGVCGPLTCAPGWVDLNGRSDDGCEARNQTCSTLAAESTVSACSNGLDDDCDGARDCADTGCAGLSQACTFQTCPGLQPWDCASRTFGGCASDPSLEATPQACSNGLDDDCDGHTDCDDPGCQGLTESCGVSLCAGVKLWVCLTRTFGLCTAVAPVPEHSDLVCGNGLDDDCNGKVDCQDPGCAGRACGAGRLCCPDGSCKPGC